MIEINFTLAMLRIHGILAQCLNSNSNKKMFQSSPKYLEVINDIMAIIENKVIEPYIKWFTDNYPKKIDARKYIEKHFKEGKSDYNLSAEFDKSVETVRRFVERSTKKYDEEISIMSKKNIK